MIKTSPRARRPQVKMCHAPGACGRARRLATLLSLMGLVLALVGCDLLPKPAPTATPLPLRATATPVAPGGATPALPGEATRAGPAPAEEKKMTGMLYHLSEGSEAPPVAERLPLAQGAPLAAEAALALLGRLPDIEAERADVTEFRLPVQSLPAPRGAQRA